MPHTVISLPAQATRATIVLDHLKEERSKGLAHQMGCVFRANEYLYLTDRELSLDQQNAAETMRDALYQRISVKRTLIDTGYKFTFAFFEEIRSLDKERLDVILHFIKATKLLLGAPGLEIKAYICVSKVRQDSIEDMERLDSCVDRLLGDVQGDAPRIVLIDALPLKDAEHWMRAVVRALNVLSRDNELSNRFKAEFFGKTIWNWTMTEFDVDAREENEKASEELKRLLNWDGVFPTSILQQNFKALVDTIQKKYRSDLELPSQNVPIPADVIGCCLRRKALQANVDAFARQLEQDFLENVTKRIVSDIAAGDPAEYCRLLLGEGDRQIPLNAWNQVGSELKKLTESGSAKMPRSLDDYPRIPIVDLVACSKVEKMRLLVQEAMDKCVEGFKRYIPLFVKLVLLENIEDYVREEEPQRRREIEDQLLRMSGGTMADVQDASDYLERLSELNEKAMAVRMLNCHSQSVYLLISDRTYGDWNALYDNHLHMNSCEVFNYHSLEEFEFQSLMLTTWDRERYERNRERFFRQDEQVF